MQNDMSPTLSTLVVETPLGHLNFYATHTGGKVGNMLLSHANLKPNLPSGMAVLNCIAVLLQFSVTQTIKHFYFCADWESLQEKGDACSGEGLDAWEWAHENSMVMVGTEDVEFFLSRRMPLQYFDSDEYPITMQDNKTRIRLQNLPVGKYSLHYIVAINDYPEPHDCSCWYAVDVPHEKVKQAIADAKQ
jgi:hypothetical protein